MKLLTLIRYGLLFSLGFLFHYSVIAQITRISGKVTDDLTNEPIPFANVAFKGTPIGTTTDVDGNYVIETNRASDTLVASFIGYNKVFMPVLKNKNQVINFVLKVNRVDLPEVVIPAGENPAHVLLKKIIASKELNIAENLDAYQYEIYNKLEFDISNIPEEFKNKKIFKPFAFVFNNIDSSSTNSKPFLPVFITESLSDFYYRKDPKAQKEIIKASKVSGIENESITQFLRDMYQNIDVYNNFIPILGKSFVSPISNIGLLYYKYFLVDSAFFGNKWCYKVTFKPRRKQELTFSGDFWVNDTTYGIKKINMRVAHDANLNFVEDLAVVQEFDRVNEKIWLLKKDQFIVEFVLKEENMGLIGRRTTSYKDFILNQPKTDEAYLGTETVVSVKDAPQRDEAYWNQVRHENLSVNEKKIYAMIDTIQSLPVFKTYVDIITIFFSGYKVIGNIELGQLYTTYSFNTIEGNRFRIGGRTSNAFSTNVLMEAYTAYGTKDKDFKYGGGVQYYLSKKPRQSIGVYYKDDVEQSGQSQNAFRDDNILSSLFRRNPATKLTSIEEEVIYYNREWFPGFSNKVSFTHRYLQPLGDFDYSYYVNGSRDIVKNSLNTSEVSLYTRFAYREKFVSGEFDRISLGTKFPVLQFQYTVGLKGVFESDFSYHKLSLKISDNFKLDPFGYTEASIEGGKVWGVLPYPLLEVHKGNETYYYDYLAFNLMNYYEFISDRYVGLALTHHFEGFFLNRIPLLRKLKWREIATAKGVIGSLEQENKDILVNPNVFSSLESKPYIEVGCGIENILKIFRLDAVWRLSYLDHPNIARFGIRGSFQFIF